MISAQGARVHLKHILLRHQYEAEDVLRKLETGTAFGEAARKFSTCPSASDGGDLGEVPLNKLDPDFAEAAKLLKPGELSDIVRTRFGYHLIKREK